MITIFVLSNARSGTTFLSNLFKKNVKGCISVHEPYWDPFNPTLFGLPIYYNTVGNYNRIRCYLERKRRRIESFKSPAYFEGSHAFLKSANKLGLEYFPNTNFVHLIREPLKVAKSAANRETLIDKYHFPLRNYKGKDGNDYFRWTLTGKEQIYEAFEHKRLTRFQHYIIEWIEIENRAMQLLNDFNMHDRCFTIHSLKELGDKEIIKNMINFHALKTFNNEVVLEGRKNGNISGPTEINRQDEVEFAEVIEIIPEKQLEIFKKPPYSSLPWSKKLLKEISTEQRIDTYVRQPTGLQPKVP